MSTPTQPSAEALRAEDQLIADLERGLFPSHSHTPDHYRTQFIAQSMREFAKAAINREMSSRPAPVTKGDGELALWKKRCGDLYELAVSLKRHASEAQSMYGVHAEELIEDAEKILSAVNSNANVVPPTSAPSVEALVRAARNVCDTYSVRSCSDDESISAHRNAIEKLISVLALHAGNAGKGDVK